MAARLLVADGHQITLHGRNETRVMEAKEEAPDANDAVIGDLSNMSGMRQVADQANALGRYDAVSSGSRLAIPTQTEGVRKSRRRSPDHSHLNVSPCILYGADDVPPSRSIRALECTGGI